MKKLVLFLAVTAALAGGAWYLLNTEHPPEADFVKPQRRDIVSTLNTNGRVEPESATAIRSDREGRIARLHVELGSRIGTGQPVVTFDSFDIANELPAAEAKVAQAEAEAKLFDRGGTPAAFAEIDAAISAARIRQEQARRDAAVAERLAAKGAATRQEVNEARDREKSASVEIESLERKRKSLVAPEGREAAEARIREARAVVAALRSKLGRVSLVASASGTVYHLAVKPGAFLHAGDLIAEIGDSRKLRAVILVDEPELGRVSKGMPVKLTWDGRPSQSWEGTVEKMPERVAPQGSRQVGEVLASISNPGGELPPGANVNVEIRTAFTANALTIPRSAVRREDGRAGVLVLEGSRVRWKPVRLGEANVTDVAVLEGLAETEAVALATETPLRNGATVRARFR